MAIAMRLAANMEIDMMRLRPIASLNTAENNIKTASVAVETERDRLATAGDI
ncbi:hypothetical protein BpJC7_27200 [Weizmannia acidilactici]|uniref:Uncharacterized protein n=1 Tax=Weizmannia acidilactici TaxID=2607726 RepID=A0A5J4JLZ7_9BACI|nr:hypothetical protein BpJC7_27200 [Weizmannia acidilactici]GER74725.1 hypothetical protein BpPP18_27920 [Weizmannia acidilactici]